MANSETCANCDGVAEYQNGEGEWVCSPNCSMALWRRWYLRTLRAAVN